LQTYGVHMRASRPSLVGSVVVLTALPHGVHTTASDARAQFGDTAATATEQMVAILYPGARIEWNGDARLLRVGHPSREVFFCGFLQRPHTDGFLFATAIEFPGLPAEITPSPFPGRKRWTPRSSRPRLAVFRSDLRGNVRHHSAGFLDPIGDATQCVDVQILSTAGQAGWPRLRVRYRSLHNTEPTSLIDWVATVDAASMVTTERLPTRIVRHVEGGSVATMLTARRVGSRSIEISGGMHRPLVYSCEERCLVSDQAVLRHQW